MALLYTTSQNHRQNQSHQNNHAHQLLWISLPNTDRFKKFFHQRILIKICNNVILNISHHTLTASLHYLVKQLQSILAHFVAGFPALVSVHQQWSVVMFSSVHTRFGLPLPCLLSVLPVSRIFFSKVLSPSLFQFISGNFISSLCKLHPLNWCKFLSNTLSSLS